MAKKADSTKQIHEWTDGNDEVLVLRFSDKNGTSYGGFQHPLNVGETVEAPDWDPIPKCGGGIHGWAWGIGLGDGKDPKWDALWQVYGVTPKEITPNVGGGPKCKFKSGVLRYGGDWHGAMNFILSGQMRWVFEASDGAASNSGDYGAASNSGDYGAASNSGDYGAASNSGYQGAASNSGYQGAASNSGYQGAASNSGDYGAALSTGEGSRADSTAEGTAAIVTGVGGKAKAAKYGCIALAFRNKRDDRIEMRCAQVGGKSGLKPDVWYELNARGNFVEV